MPLNLNIPSTPLNLDQDLYKCIDALRDAVLKHVQTTQISPAAVTNFTVTPGPGSNLIRFTRSNGQTYALYTNSVPQLDKATRIDLGLANTYTDSIGIASITRYYWVKTKVNLLESIAVGPVSGTTLALTAPTTALPAVAASQTPTVDSQGNIIPGHPTATLYTEDL